MILNDTFIVDKYFPLRAKEDNKYYVKDKVIIQDKSVDMQKLVEKNCPVCYRTVESFPEENGGIVYRAI